MNKLPHDPFMLLSTVNMYLRDTYASLEEMCQKMDIDREDLEKQLAEAGFEYNPAANKFW